MPAKAKGEMTLSVYNSKITPHKGGRTVKKSTDVTPATAAILAELWQEHHVSLGDLVAWAAPLKMEEMKGLS